MRIKLKSGIYADVCRDCASDVIVGDDFYDEEHAKVEPVVEVDCQHGSYAGMGFRCANCGEALSSADDNDGGC